VGELANSSFSLFFGQTVVVPAIPSTDPGANHRVSCQITVLNKAGGSAPPNKSDVIGALGVINVEQGIQTAAVMAQ
jgi:hypothetical protein